jgi:TadE-like protein
MRLSGTRAGDERGAVLVEAALVTPLLFLLLFGVIEFGYAFYGKLTVNNMSVVGARAASGSANDVLADDQVLVSVAGANTGISTSDIQLVVVYRATGPSDRVPTGCLTASVTNTSSVRGCNRYVSSDLARPSTDFGCVGPPGPALKVDRFWCPTDRKYALLGAPGPPDYIGVYVKANHRNLTGVLGGSVTFTTDTVMRIEPRQ